MHACYQLQRITLQFFFFFFLKPHAIINIKRERERGISVDLMCDLAVKRNHKLKLWLGVIRLNPNECVMAWFSLFLLGSDQKKNES